MFFLTYWEICFALILCLDITNSFVHIEIGVKWVDGLHSWFIRDTLRKSVTVIVAYWIGIYYGKFRLQYFLLFLAYAFALINLFAEYESINYVVFGLKIITLLGVIFMSYWYEYSPDGPYGVGYREIRIGKNPYPVVGIYYPIDRNTYDEKKNDPGEILFLIVLCIDHNRVRFAEPFKVIKAFKEHNSDVPVFLLRYFSQQRVDVIVNSPLHSEFLTDSKKLTPIIFSHGLTANKSMHVHTCKELASYGCIVYALDHTDSSCSYILDIRSKHKKDLYYVPHDEKIHKMSQEEFRMNTLNDRMKDIEVLYDYIKNNESHVDISKLIITGHSMGGITAIDAWYRYPFIKYWVSLDPFFCPRWQLIDSSDKYTISQPFIIINSIRFHIKHELVTYDSLRIMKKFVDDWQKTNKKVNKSLDQSSLFLKNSDHYSQCDVALNDGIALKLIGKIPFGNDTYKTMKENNNIIVAFLNEHNLLPVPCNLKISEVHSE